MNVCLNTSFIDIKNNRDMFDKQDILHDIYQNKGEKNICLNNFTAVITAYTCPLLFRVHSKLLHSSCYFRQQSFTAPELSNLPRRAWYCGSVADIVYFRY